MFSPKNTKEFTFKESFKFKFDENDLEQLSRTFPLVDDLLPFVDDLLPFVNDLLPLVDDLPSFVDG